MSKAASIAAVTQTLAALLEAALQAEDASYTISTLPPDRSNADADHPNRLNLFLFQVFHNAAWRNTDLPDRTRAGENGRPPLALNLSYMITAYGEPGAEGKDHRILGLAMQFLHDHPLLMASELRAAFPGTGLEDEVDRVRITPRPLTLEELVRVWGTFMTQYRISAAYDVSVVLIDSLISRAGGLPILRRGEHDEGVFAEAGLPPALLRAVPPELFRRGAQITYQSAVRLGEVLSIEGDRLPSDNVVLQVRASAWEPRWAGFANLTSGGTPSALRVTLADPPPEPEPPPGALPPLAWAPGMYSAALSFRRTGRPDLVSTAVPFALAPRVSVTPTSAPAGDVDLTLTCNPPPRVDQRVLLILSGREPIVSSAPIPPPVPGTPAVLPFHVPGLKAGAQVVRLRVDGVDSLPYRVVTAPGTPPRLEFDSAQTVVIA